MKTNFSEIQDDLTSINDLELLKIQLIHQRENLFSLIDLFIRTELSYDDTISRVDYERLSADQTQLNDEYDRLKNEYKHLGHACLYLINKTQDLIEERNRYYQEWQTNRARLTPRPDWDRVSNVIDGKFQRWKNLSTGKSSGDLMDILLREIVNGNQTENISEDEEYFSAMGEDASVLPFLRIPKYTRIVNRRMRRRMTGLLIKDIWTDKIRNPSSSFETFGDHVASYLEKRFDSKPMAIELGYNLRDACQRYHNSEQINLFWGIITGQIEELVYHHQMKSISQLLQHLIRMKTYFSSRQSFSSSPKGRKAIVSEPNSPLPGRSSILSMKEYQESRLSLLPQENSILTRDQFLEALKLFYPTKTSSQLDELFFAAQHDLQYPSQSIEYHFLFLEDDEGRWGEFLCTLLRQMHDEKMSYVEQIKQILLGHPLITVSQFCRTIYMIDPKIPQQELHRYIQWVFSVKDFHASEHIKPLDFEDLLRRLENCACFKH